MKLHKIIKQKLNDISEDNLLKSIGYKNLRIGKKTLYSFLKQKNIYKWLQQGHYDLKHTSESFLLGLIRALDIPKKDHQSEIQKAKHRLTIISEMTQPIIFVDTHFERTIKPILAIAALSRSRYIEINKEKLVGKTDEQALEIVGDIIKKHYSKTGGELRLFGKIQNYIYTHSNGDRYIFNTDGKCILLYCSTSASQNKNGALITFSEI